MPLCDRLLMKFLNVCEFELICGRKVVRPYFCSHSPKLGTVQGKFCLYDISPPNILVLLPRIRSRVPWQGDVNLCSCVSQCHEVRDAIPKVKTIVQRCTTFSLLPVAYYFYFYELRSLVSLRYLYSTVCFCIASVLLPLESCVEPKLMKLISSKIAKHVDVLKLFASSCLVVGNWPFSNATVVRGEEYFSLAALPHG